MKKYYDDIDIRKLEFDKNADPQLLLKNARIALSYCKQLDRKSDALYYVQPYLKNEYLYGVCSDILLCYASLDLAMYLINCKMHLQDLFTSDRELDSKLRGVLLACVETIPLPYNWVPHNFKTFLYPQNGPVVKAFLKRYGKDYPEFAEFFQKELQVFHNAADGNLAVPNINKDMAKTLLEFWETY